MQKLSVTIITLNEEQNILDALESVKWADEIVVVDSGSTDKTVEICKEYTDKVFYNPWPGYMAQKNLAIDKASHTWILSIDADERVTPLLASEIQEALKEPKADAYAVPRHVFYVDRWIDHSGWYPDYKIRLFRRDKAEWGGGNLHETIVVNGDVKYLKGDLLHYTFRDLAHHVNTLNNFTSVAAREYAETGKRFRLTDMLFRPFFMFFKSYILKQGFRDGLPGVIISVTAGYHVFVKYAKLWELSRTQRRDG
ncbi:MAG: waaE [Deltaproteobacteria bacterium]|nr:waaE [Deltaproteobacteria bacterium]